MKKQTEKEIIKKLTRLFNIKRSDIVKGIGDDCAVIKGSKEKYFIYTCDSQAEDVHFKKNLITPQKLGKRAVTVAISDIAAMGGEPLYVLVSLFLPKNYSHIEQLTKGITLSAKKYGVSVIGGNISRSEKLILDVFVIGKVERKKLVLRSGANPDDLVLVTGTLGNADEPIARIHEAQIIANYATSMIDISDGLSTDLSHICDESEVGVEVFEDRLPRKQSSIEEALHRGEDYELCFTAPEKYAQEVIKSVKKETGTKITVIGKITKKEKGRWILFDDRTKKKLTPSGWDHLS